VTFETFILFATPMLLLLFAIEFPAAMRQNKPVYSSPTDAIGSISSGIANVPATALGIGVALVPYDWMLDHFACISL